MKRKNQLFILIALSTLFSCTNVKRHTSNEDAKQDTAAKSAVTAVAKSDGDSYKTEIDNDVLSNVNYFFSNDTLCQNLNLKKIVRKKKLEMPEKLEFKLVLHDKLAKFDDKIFEGVAKLTSPNESFSDSSVKDGGAYDAADYEMQTPNYTLQIRLDVDGYEASVIQIYTNKPDSVLGGYSSYLKKFPDGGVMKKGQCK